MPLDLASYVPKFFKGLFEPEVTEDGPNPVHLAIATRGYHVQSRILCIPDRLGFFSPGPPRLQVFEGATFGHVILAPGIVEIFWVSLIVWLLRHAGQPVAGLLVGLIFFALVRVVGYRLLVSLLLRTDPKYNTEEWKRLKQS